MICYKDMTFCNARCANSKCTRKLTEEVIQGAEDWWGSTSAPVAVSDLSGVCDDYIQEIEDE